MEEAGVFVPCTQPLYSCPLFPHKFFAMMQLNTFSTILSSACEGPVRSGSFLSLSKSRSSFCSSRQTWPNVDCSQPNKADDSLCIFCWSSCNVIAFPSPFHVCDNRELCMSLQHYFVPKPTLPPPLCSLPMPLQKDRYVIRRRC